MRTNWAVLPLRLAVGTIFIAHGSQKLFGAFGGSGITGSAAGFAHLGLNPGIFWAWVVAITEFFGGLGILGGLLTRVSALGISAIMIVGVITVHGKNGFFAKTGGFEYNLMILGAAVALIILGAGDYSLDALIARLLKSRRKSVAGGGT